MSVYFVYRSHYDTPSLNYLRRFDDDSVLAWFQRHWRGFDDYDQAADYANRIMGRYVYGFSSLFRNIAEHSLARPESPAALKRLLNKHLYVEGEIRCQPHVIQVLTDDDELEMAYYFFDDHFLAEHADRAAFLLHEDWRLPDTSGTGEFKPRVTPGKLKPGWRGEGVTYLAFLAWYDSGNLDDIEGPWSIRGVRLPELARYLATTVPPPGSSYEGGWPFELHLLRSQLLLDPPRAQREEKSLLRAIRDNPEEESRWLVYADWLEEHGQSRNAVLQRALSRAGRYPVGHICNSLDTREIQGDNPAEARQQIEPLVAPLQGKHGNNPKKSLVQVNDHIAQLILHTARWGKKDLYHRWVLFDDLWASAQPVLANAILRYASRWDVLT